MRAADFAGSPIHRAAEADTDGGWFMFLKQLTQPSFDGLADARRTFHRCDLELALRQKFSLSAAEGELELGSSDLDAKKNLVGRCVHAKLLLLTIDNVRYGFLRNQTVALTARRNSTEILRLVARLPF